MAENNDKEVLNVPHLRFPEFSGEWKKYTLGELGKTFNGLTGKSGSDFGRGFPYITYKSVFDNSKIDVSRVEYVEITDIERKQEIQNKVQYGDVFFTTSSETPDEVGMSSVLLDEVKDYYLNSFCFGYRLNSLSDTIPEFMRFLLRSQTIRRKMFVLAQGSTRFNISKGEVMEMLINIPRSKEQRKIANLLTLLDDRIATQNKIIEDLKKLKSAIIEEHYTQVDKQCVLVSELGKPFSVGNLSKEELSETGTPCVVYGELFTTYGATINEVVSHTNKLEEMTLSKKGDLLFPSSTTVDAISLIAPSVINVDNVILGGDMFGIHINSNHNALYLSYFFNHIAKRQLAKYAKGSTIIHLHYNDIEKAKLLLPCLKEQNRMARCMAALDEKISIDNSLLSFLNCQKAYLLRQMFI